MAKLPSSCLRRRSGAFAQRLDHEASIFVKDAIGPAILRERVMQVGRHAVELEHKRSGKLFALGVGDGLVGQRGFRRRAWAREARGSPRIARPRARVMA